MGGVVVKLVGCWACDLEIASCSTGSRHDYIRRLGKLLVSAKAGA